MIYREVASQKRLLKSEVQKDVQTSMTFRHASMPPLSATSSQSGFRGMEMCVAACGNTKAKVKAEHHHQDTKGYLWGV